jgi:cytochrome c peroxidase
LKKKYPYVVLIFLITVFSFTADNSYFLISKKDVQLKIPKGFPAPVYQFKNNKVTPEAFLLGRRLFYDPILSRDSSTSCASCHQRFAAFAHVDHPLSHGINGLIGTRNVPAIQNEIWSTDFMWDGSVNHIELQPLAPLTNPVEMNEKLEHVIQKLQQTSSYVAMFSRAYHDTLVTSEKMLKAISQFVGLMISSDSRYDKFNRGEDTLSTVEMNGLKLFRNHCTSCHKEPLFTDNSFRNIGLKPDTALHEQGRQHITGLDSDFMKFKVPSLRNVEMTYPYMHDGRFKNLQQVMNHYAEGNFSAANVDPAIIKNIGLTETEKSEIISFLKTLTDKTFLYDRRFIDPNSK